jgi:hypothetical protein
MIAMWLRKCLLESAVNGPALRELRRDGPLAFEVIP